jgi:putative SOS response-associated peptidase YedK
VCSRYTYKKDEARIKLREKIEVFGCVPRGDIRPTDLAPVILPDEDSFSCREMRWGWRVSWDKSPLINAKSETLTTLPTFKPHLNNRCLILADGFFEKGVRFVQTGEPLFALAGLWQKFDDGEKFTMLTTTPNASVSPYHHRMPFLIPPERYADWLGEAWLQVLETPDKSPLEKIQKQPELF